MQWLHEVDEDRAFISVVTLAEIRMGIRLMPHGRRREALSEWLERDLPVRFSGRVVPVDDHIALAWGDVVADCQKQGHAIAIMDAFLAATALQRDLTLVTRNVDDFARLGIRILNPWVSQ